MNDFKIDLENAQPYEAFFPPELTDFLIKLNFTKNEEDVFSLMEELTRLSGFEGVIYEYCPNIYAEAPDLFMRTNLSENFLKFEQLASKKKKPGFGRAHSQKKWTPAVGGYEFSDLYTAYPTQIWKYRASALITGLRSGFGVPLRSPDPDARAGFGFASKMRRAEFEESLKKHGWSLNVASWAAHTRILQHVMDAKAVSTPLTVRQQTYLSHLAAGLLDKQIAHEMQISHSAVRKFQYAVAARLNVTRRTEIVSKATELGILKPPPSKHYNPKARWDLKIL